MNWAIWICTIATFAFQLAECQQRVAPGVPPQQYQQPHGHDMHQMPHNPQQYQPPPPPQHQQPMHQQQQMHHQPQQHHQQQQQHVPMHQPAQHQVPVQQQGHGHGHDHGHHGQQQVLNANVAQERSHIAEHMEVPIDTSKMTDQELQFHYFKMHDSDGNNKLDGCELIKSLIHWHEQGNKDPHTSQGAEKLFRDEELTELIDPILNMDDANKDGYIDYPEFIQAQQKSAATGRPDHA